MSLRGVARFALLLAALAPVPAAAAPEPPAGPHRQMNSTGECDRCHEYWAEELYPHEFVVKIPESCWECHPREKLGNSHPIGVNPRHSSTGVIVPAELPLEDGEVSCGTCHQPHNSPLSKTKAFADQEIKLRQGGIPWYSTLFLRKSDPVHGFEPLCMACHRNF